jgi:PAS domain S-box-containing protein
LLLSGKFTQIVLAVQVFLVGLLILGVTGAVASANNQFFSDLVQSAVALSAGACAFLAGKRSGGYLRRLWFLFTAGIFFTFLAQALVTYFNNISHRSAVTPWPSDILFILWVLPILMMLMPQTAEESGGTDWLAVLDFMQVGIVALTAYVYLYYVAAVWQSAGHQMVLKVMKLQGYRDLAVAAAFVAASRSVSCPPLRSLYNRVAVFFFAEVAPTLLYLFSRPAAAGRVSWSGVAWCVPYLILTVIVGTWKGEVSPGKEEPAAPFRNTIISQTLPVCIPLLVLLMGKQIAREQTTTVWAAIAASFCVSAARLVLTNEKQRRIADALRKTEIALLQSSEMFAAAFHSSPDAIIISLMPEGRYVTVNESFLRLTGYAREEVVGKSAAELKLWANDEHRARVLALLGTAAEIKEEEIEIRTKSGEIRNAQLSAARVQLVDGTGVLGMLRDVTDRRRAEEALRVSEERFRSLVQDMHVGIVLLGPRAETIYANAAALDMFGLQPEDVHGKSSSQFEVPVIHEDGTQMPFSERPGPRVIATKRPIYNQVVGWRRASDGDVIWALVDAVPQMTQQGEIANVVLTISNITELKRAEKALQTSEELFRTLVESMSICVVLLSPNAEILFANQATLQLFGRTPESVVGKTTQELGVFALREDGTEIPFEMMPGPQAIETRNPVRNQLIGWRQEATSDIIWTTCEVVPVFDKEGRLEKMVGAVTNITKLKEAEENMHQLSARLLRLQDEERRRLGRELHDSLAQSVMAVSLDLAQVARSPAPLDKTSKHSLAQARGVLRDMSREIRTLSYLLHPPVLDELGLVSAVKEYANGFSERSGITLHLDIQPDFARISEEAETALFRIVQESLSNIQRHSGSLKGLIRLRSEQGRVQLEVHDAGCGIAAGSSGDSGAKQKASRLGVGILGMRERMAQLGGTLEVLSGPSGTTVKATMPITVGTTHATPSHTRG